MRLSSFRLMLLGLVARVLHRLLGAVTATIGRLPPQPPSYPPYDTHEEPSPAPLPDNAAYNGQPPLPPDHWVELVRQHAPQLLQDSSPAAASEALDSLPATVIDWRSDDALIAPPQVNASPAKARPVSVITPRHHSPTPVPTVTTTPKRPMRLGQVRVQPLDAQDVSERAAQSDSDALEVKTVLQPNTDALEVKTVAPTSTPAETLNERTNANSPYNLPVASHFADLPLEPHVREVRSATPDSVEVSTIRTSTGNNVRISQQRTRLPAVPQQTILRPTITQTPLNIEQVTPDRWAALPDSPAADMPDLGVERQRRERIKREQEGRQWSE